MEFGWCVVGPFRSNNPAIFWLVGNGIGYLLGVEQPKSCVPGGNVANVGWSPPLANEVASRGLRGH